MRATQHTTAAMAGPADTSNAAGAGGTPMMMLALCKWVHVVLQSKPACALADDGCSAEEDNRQITALLLLSSMLLPLLLVLLMHCELLYAATAITSSPDRPVASSRS